MCACFEAKNSAPQSVDTARSAKLASFDKYAFDLGHLGTSSLENNKWQAIMDYLKSLLTKNDGELRPGIGERSKSIRAIKVG